MLDSSYLRYSKNENNLFYSEPNKIDKVENRLVVSNFSSNDWVYTVDTDWIYMMCKNEKDLPDQGWKIHITATPQEAQEELYIVSQYLIYNDISFKYVPTIEKLIEKNSKNANRASSGKFITIYPHDTKTFIKLLNKLHSLTKFYKNGPYILNDKQWKNGNVFFRYGGFKEIILEKDGHKIDAIRDPNGNLIADKRVPYYYLPEFVKEPIEIQQEEVTISDNEYNSLNEYKILHPIVFSNAGGVYKATINNKDCILKEGRPNAGLDANKTDGYYRILSEYRVLKNLKNNPFVVNVNNYFTAWKHDFLEEDFVPGYTLDEFIALRFPFNPLSCKKDDIKKYTSEAIFIIKELVKAIKSIHSQGVAIGDLQPSNVIFSEKLNKITLIDFEEAKNPNTKFTPGLMTLGFVSNNAKTFGEADWFAIGKIIYFLFMPIEAANSSLTPEIELIYNQRIESIFGSKAVDFVNQMKIEISRHTRANGSPLFIKEFLKLPSQQLTMDNTRFFINQLRQGIINNLNFQSQGLIKGDIKQYKDAITRYSIGYGAFGGIMALTRSGGIPDENIREMENWLFKNCLFLSSIDYDQNNSYGLFNGLAGICSVLFDLGKKKLATQLLKKIKLSKLSDMSIYCGVSGIGLAFLAGFIITNDEELLSQCFEAANLVKQDFLNRKKQPVKTERAGLLNGLAGEALFLYKVGEKTDKKEYKNTAIDILDYIIKYQLKYDQDKNLFVNDTSRKIQRLIPYLNDGSAGIAIAMIAIYKDQKSFLTKERKKTLRDLIAASCCASTVEAGIFDGYSGFLILGNLVRRTFNDDHLTNYIVDGLNMYLFSNGKSEIYLPGNTGLKCSMDVITGASGLILALLGVDSNKWELFLPLPIKAKMF